MIPDIPGSGKFPIVPNRIIAVLWLASQVGLLGFQDQDLGSQDDLEKKIAMVEKTAKEPFELVPLWNRLGKTLLKKGDVQKARGPIEKSAKFLNHEKVAAPDRARSHYLVGLLAWFGGDLERARLHFVDALEIFEQLNHGRGIADLTNALGTISLSRHELYLADWYFRRSHYQMTALNPKQAYPILANIGLAALERGDLATARLLCQEALQEQELHFPNSPQTASTLHNLGRISELDQDDKGARDYYQRAIGIMAEIDPNSVRVGEGLVDLALNRRKQGEFNEAETHLAQAEAVFTKHGPKSLMMAGVRLQQGQLALDKGRLDHADRAFWEALNIILRRAPNTLAEGMARHGMGRLSLLRGRLQEAVPIFEKALACAETHLSKLGGLEQVQAEYGQNTAQLYHDAMILYLELGRPLDAFYVSERFKARTMLRMMAHRGSLPLVQLTPDMRKRRTELEQQLDAAYQSLATARDSREVERLKALLAGLDHQRIALDREVYELDPRLANIHIPRPLHAPEAINELEPGTIALSYVCLPRETLLFQLGPDDGDVNVFRIAVGLEEWRDLVTQFREEIFSAAGGKPTRGLLHYQGNRLFRQLLGPVTTKIDRAERILISGDGWLNLLPFSALVRRLEKGEQIAFQWLVGWKPIAVVPSLTVYAKLNSQSKPTPFEASKFLGFADPTLPTSGSENHAMASPYRSLANQVGRANLPFARQEVRAVAALFTNDPAVLVGNWATEQQAKRRSGEADFLHFACHGLVNPMAPMSSGLFLATDEQSPSKEIHGLLQAWEVAESFRLKTQLVVLSACDTGQGKQISGEGVLGLTRAFHYAGANSVISTLWRVSDEKTASLMTTLYRELKAGRNKAEALRRAQLKLIGSADGISLPTTNQTQGSHPYFWAGFTLSGRF